MALGAQNGDDCTRCLPKVAHSVWCKTSPSEPRWIRAGALPDFSRHQSTAGSLVVLINTTPSRSA